MKRRFLALFIISFAIVQNGRGQEYFGENKVQYDQFRFAVYKTPHFDVHYYPEEAEAAKLMAQMAEVWYDRISKVLRFEFIQPNPIILYASPEHFAQTDVIPGILGEGIGGVTEGGRNRVILPLSANWRDNNHVLGHELVHAFQYRMLSEGDSTSLRNVANVPLWMIEGLAEYLSIGSYDPNTTMWLRDAIINDKFPTLQKMTADFRYFPYRWGQAFWAYVAGRWGDGVIPYLFRYSAMMGYDYAIPQVLGVSVKDFNQQWRAECEAAYRSYLDAQIYGISSGKALFEDRKAIQEQDFAPAISPNGKYVVFLSARNLFTLDLYLADARTRKIIRRLRTQRSDAHGNAMRLIESAAAWSPDSKSVAYFSYEGGEHYLRVQEAETDKNRRNIRLEKFQSVLNPAWSPDGKKLAFVGVQQGSSDLYVYDFRKEEITRLTDDSYSDLQPSWTPDSKSLVWITDRFSGTDLSKMYIGNFEVARINAATKEMRQIPLFAGVNHLNPQFSRDSTLYFISAPDGVNNIYRLNSKTGDIERVTRESTATAGITDLSPALSLALKTGDVIYSAFKESGYQLFAIRQKEIKALPVSPDTLMEKMAGALPPLNSRDDQQVLSYTVAPQNRMMADSAIVRTPYKPKLSLSSVSNAGIGVGVGPYGAGIGGSVNMIFSDMLDEHIVYGAVAAYGSIQDIGGIIGYLNQKHRLSWGLSLSHIPYSYYNYYAFNSVDSIDGVPTLLYNLDNYVLREFNDAVTAVAYYPLSRVYRIEGALGVTFLNYSYTIYRDVYLADQFGYPIYQIDRQKEKLNAPTGYQYGTASLAFVADDSKYGFTSPLDGYRFRIGTDVIFGDYKFTALLGDFRAYKFVKPVSFAGRVAHYGRYFGQANDSLAIAPLTVGVDYLIRGYNYYSIDYAESPTVGSSSPTIDRLFGSKYTIINFEVRFPLSGPREIAPIKSLALPSTLQLFFDGGVTWGSVGPTMEWTTDYETLAFSPKHYPMFSAGASIRVNILGALVLEGYYAIPFQRPLHDPFNHQAIVEANRLSNGVFGLLLYPGW
jgi:hypothetical protein